MPTCGRDFIPIITALVLAIHTSALRAAEPADYQQNIKPLFAARCIACHGVLKQEAGLRLDTGELARKGAESGPVIAPRDADASLILQRVSTADSNMRMPPEGEPLTPLQIQQLTDWITAGAISPADEKPELDPREHWAFQEIKQPKPPKLAGQSASWALNPIDAFVADGLRAQGLQPQTPANRSEQIRRLYVDLIGLPPTLDEWETLAQDTHEGWYERLVDRLLNDPRYGQRWARHWMDIWRYSDWWGLGDQLRNSQMHMWHWRDWIVESLNKDARYDEMVRLMLAGDELRPTNHDDLRATGFLARNYFLFNRHQWMDETVEHVSKGILGLTMNCAKCHDHKYDPIQQVDYYRMRAFFEPYYVRMDMLPGELDLSRDGLPRVYESQSDAPTYLFVRGQETQPDKSKVIPPGVPSIVSFEDLNIESLKLPAEAWQPERNAYVAKAYTEAAHRKVVEAEKTASAARSRVQELQTANVPSPSTTPPAPEVVPFVDRFESVNEQQWRSLSGQWRMEGGKLQQLQDGPTRSVLRCLKPAPQDFEATLKFTILGGSQWRSVCLCFDANEADPNQSSASDSQQTVYVSAVEGGSKLQAAVGRGGKWEYPGDAAVPRAIALNQEYSLRIQVRGTLINAYLNDEFLLAWNSSLERKSGSVQLETFDALAAFHSFELKPLEPGTKLRGPAGKPTDAASELAAAEQTLKFAERDLAIAAGERELLGKQLLAMQADWAWQDRPAESELSEDQKAAWDEKINSAHREAIKLARELEVTKQQRALDGHQAELATQTGAKRAATEKQVKSTREALEKAQKTLGEEIKPTDRTPHLVAAKWTATRFLNSGADDPAVALGPKSSGRRTALAKWMTDRRNPLTARVAVNHMWTRHFGTSLVDTPFDFGRKTPEPRHRQLLDWMAAEFIRSGWSMKELHRLIVCSATYRMSSSTVGREENVVKDPDNLWWWRRHPIRIESQVVRDGILALAGTLDATAGGPPIMPGDQANSRRRSLYFFHSNNERNMFLTTFDEAPVKECYRREQSIVPQQALALTNSQLVLDASKPMAERIAKSLPEPNDDRQYVQQAFRVVLGIEPSQAELEAGAKAMSKWREASDNQNRGAHELLVWALLNHNDFVTLR